MSHVYGAGRDLERTKRSPGTSMRGGHSRNARNDSARLSGSS